MIIPLLTRPQLLALCEKMVHSGQEAQGFGPEVEEIPWFGVRFGGGGGGGEGGGVGFKGFEQVLWALCEVFLRLQVLGLRV